MADIQALQEINTLTSFHDLCKCKRFMWKLESALQKALPLVKQTIISNIHERFRRIISLQTFCIQSSWLRAPGWLMTRLNSDWRKIIAALKQTGLMNARAAGKVDSLKYPGPLGKWLDILGIVSLFKFSLKREVRVEKYFCTTLLLFSIRFLISLAHSLYYHHLIKVIKKPVL